MTEPVAGEPTSQERNWATVMHLCTLATYFVGGWLLNIAVPLVVLLLKGSDSEFVAAHAREQLNFQISLVIYTVAAVLLAILTLGIGLLVIVPVYIVVAIVVVVATGLAAVAASGGRPYRLPFTIRFVKG